jgi:hypothetical protein
LQKHGVEVFDAEEDVEARICMADIWKLGEHTIMERLKNWTPFCKTLVEEVRKEKNTLCTTHV